MRTYFYSLPLSFCIALVAISGALNFSDVKVVVPNQLGALITLEMKSIYAASDEDKYANGQSSDSKNNDEAKDQSDDEKNGEDAGKKPEGGFDRLWDVVKQG